MFWVNQYPVDNDSMVHIEEMFRANIKERCEKSYEQYDPDRVTIIGSPSSASPFKVPAGGIAGVYWWEYLD